MEGLRELAVAIFDNMPVRIGQPNEMGGLFYDVRGAEYAAAVGLIKYAADNYSSYEIDVNKRMRHHSEAPAQEIAFETTLEEAMQEEEIPLTYEREEPSTLSNLSKLAKLPKMSQPKERKKEEAGAVSKFWNWATQLF